MDGEPLISQFQNEIDAVIEKYNDSGLTLGETVGVLELCKLGVVKNSEEDEDDLL